MFPTKMYTFFLLPHACHISSPSHPPSFDHPNIICWEVQILQTFPHCPLSSATLDPGAVLNSLTFHNLSLCTSTNIRSDTHYCTAGCVS
jgi:hypothetical protein